MTLASGTVLANRYRVLARLGEGGMGSVYQVEDLKRPSVVYALKALLDDTNTSPEDMAWAAKRFDEEITLLSRLSHPRIPAFVDRFTEGGRRYFVMEYIPGMTLEQRQEHAHAPLPERDVLGWMVGVCDVLAYLHSQRPPIIVRDLKPGNIMVTPSSDVRLIDFGIARTYKAGKASNTENLGTMTYASPEHLGQTQTDARSDIYSLGATIYHLLTNAEPVPLETPAPGQVRKYQPGLSEATERVVIRAMKLNAAERFQTAVEFREALRACLDALPAPVGVATSSGTVSPTPRTAVPAHPAPSGGVICPRCGFFNRSGARFCANDGVPLVPSAKRPPAKPASRPQAAPATRIVPTATTADLYARKATEAFGAGKYLQAVQQSEAAITQGRATYDVYLLLGRAQRQLGRAGEAAQAFAEAGRLRPSAEAAYQEGMAWREAGEALQAQLAFSRARQLDSRNAEIPYQLGLICLGMGQLAQAEGELRDALTLRPDDGATLVALGKVEIARQRLDEAVEYLRRAVALEPREAAGHLELGRALMGMGRLPQATKELEQAAKLAPESAEAQTALGMAYHAGGRRSQARTALKKAVALNPRDAEAQQLLKQM
ncbi:MAG TPA: protein kinase [Ktedonobacterales bacterium]